MRKKWCILVIFLTFLHMSQLHVLANYQNKIETANSEDELKQQIQQAVMQLTTDFEIRYTGNTAFTKEELTAIIKRAIPDPYIYANIASFKWHYSGYVKNIVITFQFNYHHSKIEEAFVDYTLTKQIESMRGLNDFEKVKAAHDWIVLTTAYSSMTENSQYSPYTLLTENKAVCQAYALVLYRMLEKLGFDVRYVAGDAREQLHAWVLVNLQGAWYHIDVTWDDPVPDYPNEVRYNYFLLSDEQMAKDHEWDRTLYPVAPRDYSFMQIDTVQTSLTSTINHSYVNPVGVVASRNASIDYTQLLAVAKQTINKQKDGHYSKQFAEYIVGIEYSPLFFNLTSNEIVQLNYTLIDKSQYTPQLIMSHKKLVVIIKGVSHEFTRDTLALFIRKYSF